MVLARTKPSRRNLTLLLKSVSLPVGGWVLRVYISRQIGRRAGRLTILRAGGRARNGLASEKARCPGGGGGGRQINNSVYDFT